MNEKKLIVISAVNLRKGGTLTILRQCLEYLSDFIRTANYRVVAIVHKRSLCDYEGIEYMEMPQVASSWSRRLWCEYVTMHRLSKELAPVYLWLSLHDTSPRVLAERQAVYCQTSFPFYEWSWKDFRFDYKIPLFACFTQFAYRVNVHSNRYLIVQQEWLRQGLSKLLGVRKEKFIVAPPVRKILSGEKEAFDKAFYTFIYPATPDCHKNFETLCEAARLLEKEVGPSAFRVLLTLTGKENKYAQWLKEKWGEVVSIQWTGFLSKSQLKGVYEAADCLVFPSKVETWGLPISEYMQTGKPMLIADLPYGHETAAGSRQTAFFDQTNAEKLKDFMKQVLLKNTSCLSNIDLIEYEQPFACSWKMIFEKLLKE